MSKLKTKPIRRYCASCSHSHYAPYGSCNRTHLLCSIHPHPDRGIICIVREGMPACPSYDEQFNLDHWRRGAPPGHAWQQPTYADTLDT